MADEEIDKYINDYYVVNRDQKLEYSRKYYEREGMREKRSAYNKKYYNERKKYLVCNKCNIAVLEHNFNLHKASFRHINGRRPKPSEYKMVKIVKIEDKPKPPLLDKIELII